MNIETKPIQNFLSWFIVIIIACTLINTNLFIYPSMGAFYSYTILISLYVVITLLIIFFRYRHFRLNFGLPLILLLLLAIYTVIHGVISSGINLKHFYIIFSTVFFICLFLVFRTIGLNTKYLSNGILCLAIIESAICVLQYYKMFPVENAYFDVTGTWANPNVTAMFLAMAIPVATIGLYQKKLSNKIFNLVVFSLIGFALYLLRCRSAFVGALVSLGILINYRYNFFSWLRDVKNRFKSILIIAVSVLFAVFLTTHLYNAKRSSAEGRKLIWKLSATMIRDRPVVGYGYGSFERYYNLQQADYFRQGKGTELEKSNSGHVKMAYSEFIENTVQGGIIGGLLFTIFLFSLLLVFPKKRITSKENNNINEELPADDNSLFSGVVAYSGIACFVTMSIFNFTVQAVPAFCLFIIYAAISNAAHRRLEKREMVSDIHGNLSFNSAVLATLLLVICYCCFDIVRMANADLQNRSAKNLAVRGKLKEALQILKPLETKLSTYDGYWMNYGNVLYQDKNYASAVENYNIAKNISSNPEIYIKAAKCYIKLNNKVLAIDNLEMASNMVPSRFAPRFLLMKLYQEMGNSAKAILMANQIISLTPKIHSNESDLYKNSALLLLRSYGIN